jgi:hypothetical protein
MRRRAHDSRRRTGGARARRSSRTPDRRQSRRSGPPAGGWHLVQAGAGGVGHMSVQIARLAGAWVATTVTAGPKEELAASLGAELCIDLECRERSGGPSGHPHAAAQLTGVIHLDACPLGLWLARAPRAAALDPPTGGRALRPWRPASPGRCHVPAPAGRRGAPRPSSRQGNRQGCPHDGDSRMTRAYHASGFTSGIFGIQPGQCRGDTFNVSHSIRGWSPASRWVLYLIDQLTTNKGP